MQQCQLKAGCCRSRLVDRLAASEPVPSFVKVFDRLLRKGYQSLTQIRQLAAFSINLEYASLFMKFEQLCQVFQVTERSIHS